MFNYNVEDIEGEIMVTVTAPSVRVTGKPNRAHIDALLDLRNLTDAEIRRITYVNEL